MRRRRCVKRVRVARGSVSAAHLLEGALQLLDNASPSASLGDTRFELRLLGCCLAIGSRTLVLLHDQPRGLDALGGLNARLSLRVFHRRLLHCRGLEARSFASVRARPLQLAVRVLDARTLGGLLLELLPRLRQLRLRLRQLGLRLVELLLPRQRLLVARALLQRRAQRRPLVHDQPRDATNGAQQPRLERARLGLRLRVRPRVVLAQMTAAQVVALPVAGVDLDRLADRVETCVGHALLPVYVEQRLEDRALGVFPLRRRLPRVACPPARALVRQRLVRPLVLLLEGEIRVADEAQRHIQLLGVVGLRPAALEPLHCRGLGLIELDLWLCSAGGAQGGRGQ
eukprot:7391751-Prymnesium_polylepis.1